MTVLYGEMKVMDKKKPSTATRRYSSMMKTKRVFLNHLALSANVTSSARVARVERGTVYRWKEQDPVFADAWAQALEEATDILEAEARRRAVEGIEEPILSRGEIINDPVTGSRLMRRRYSDGLMRFLLKAHRPSRFGEREGEGNISVHITRDDAAL